jgi:hypothetical protein
MKLYLKFNDQASSPARTRVLRLLRRGGAVRVGMLFPRTAKASLKGHYVAEVENRAGAKRLVDALAAMPDVEFAHMGGARAPVEAGPDG